MKKSGMLLFLCLWMFPNDSFSQNKVPNITIDSVEARNLLSKSSTLFDLDSFKESSKLAEIAYNFYQNNVSKSSPELAEAAYQFGRSIYRLKNYTRAKDLLIEANSIWESYTPKYEIQIAKAFYYLAYIEFRTGNISEAIKLSTKALSIQNSYFANATEIIKTYLLVAQLYNLSGNFKQATLYYEQAIELTKPEYGVEEKYCISVLMQLASNYKNQANHLSSISLNEQAIWYLERSSSPKDNKTTQCLLEIGGAYHSLNKIELALLYFQKALDFSLKLNPLDSQKVSYCYSRISDAYYTLKDPNNALVASQNVIEMLQGLEKEKIYRYACINLGKAYLLNNELISAQTWFNKALENIGKPADNNDSSDLAMTLLYIGRVKTAQGDYTSSVAALNNSKNIIIALYGNAYDGLYTVEKELGNLNASYFNKTGDSYYLAKSLYHYDSATYKIQNKLINKKDPAEIRNLLIDAVSIFEKCINGHLKLNNGKKSDSTTIHRIWELNEFLHSYLLYFQFKDNNALNNSGIPPDLLTQDSMYRSEITKLEKHRNFLLENNNFSLTDTIVLKLNTSIFKNKVQRQELITNFEKKYPHYLSKKFDHKIVTIPQVKELIKPNQTILEYFCGDSSLFVFIIQKSNTHVKEIKIDIALKTWIKNLNNSIYAYHTSKVRTDRMYKEQLDTYIESARNLYNLLLKPVANYLTPELIIIPDAILGNIPFDALLTAQPKDPSNFKTFPFLVNRYSIQYSFSSGMLVEMSRVDTIHKNTVNLLGFAPFFNKEQLRPDDVPQKEMAQRYELTNLPYSGEEIVRAKTNFPNNSMILTGQDATRQKFEELSKNYHIIHLATHGKANYKDGDFSFIAFSSQENQDQYDLLSVAELYNLKLNADLVILSACETANGEIHRGEGVVSIASAFAHAGVKSVVATLWKVNDKSTMQLVDQFYTELKLGKQKHTALAQAKRNYMKNNPGQASHPFFWAGFIPIGNMGAILN